MSAISDAAVAADRLKPHRVTVLGYAGETGATPVTDLMARERADRVADELNRLGVDETLLAVHSYRAGKLFVGSGERADPPSTRVDVMLEK